MQNNPERALIAAILNSPADSFLELDRLGVTAEDFFHLETRAMFLELSAMREAGDPIDPATLSQRVPQKYLAAPWEVTSEYPAALAGFWAQAVADLSKRRRLLELAETLRTTAGDLEANTEELIDKALASISKEQGKGLVTHSETLRQAAARVIDDLDNSPNFIPTPWPALNEVLGGLRPGAFYVIAARPGVGKTLIGLQLAQAVASADRQAAFFSFEMTAPELATRALASKTGINLSQIDRRNLNEEEKRKLSLAHKELNDTLHLVGEKGSRQVTQLRPAIRSISTNNRGKLGSVFIDYLGLLDAKGSSLYEKVTAISGQLKSLAMELEVPIVALAQLNRKAEDRTGAPSLADLRDSGAIEQDADAVLMLSNDQYGKLSLTIQKNRQGELASFTGDLHRPTMTLKSLIKD